MGVYVFEKRLVPLFLADAQVVIANTKWDLEEKLKDVVMEYFDTHNTMKNVTPHVGISVPQDLIAGRLIGSK